MRTSRSISAAVHVLFQGCGYTFYTAPERGRIGARGGKGLRNASGPSLGSFAIIESLIQRGNPEEFNPGTNLHFAVSHCFTGSSGCAEPGPRRVPLEIPREAITRSRGIPNGDRSGHFRRAETARECFLRERERVGEGGREGGRETGRGGESRQDKRRRWVLLAA